MPHDEVEHTGVVNNRQIVWRIRPATHAHRIGAIFVSGGDVRTHVRNVIKHKAVFIVDRERPEGAVIGVFERR